MSLSPPTPAVVPPRMISTPAAEIFTVVQDFSGSGTTWDFNADQLTVATESEPDGPDVKTHGHFQWPRHGTLTSAHHQFSVDTPLNVTPYWDKDSAVCKFALTPGKGSLAALGIGSATKPEQWVDYSRLPYCGLNWKGFDIKGPNKETMTKATVDMKGSKTETYTVPAATAEAVAQSFVAPDGWMFNYYDTKGICGTLSFGMGRIVHASTQVC